MIILWLSCSSPDVTKFPFEEVYEQGAGRYLDQFSPDEVFDLSEDVQAHRFIASETGPICMNGSDFHTMVRDQQSDYLLFFLQGGGLCSSELCLSVPSGSAWFPDLDIFASSDENPVNDWNQVYVPYCDGSLFSSDAQVDLDADGVVDRYHHGLHNLSAALDVAKTEFPEPKKILLAGSSGGGYGTLAATMLARWTWPNSAIYVFNDSGIGLGKEGNPYFINSLIDEFNASSILPNSQTDLLSEGHLTPLVSWQLQQDPNLKIAGFSFLRDYVISQMYLETAYEAFESQIRTQTQQIHQAYPNRYQYFLKSGAQHTVLLGDPSGFVDPDSAFADLLTQMLASMYTTEIEGESTANWLSDLINDSPDWTSHSE